MRDERQAWCLASTVTPPRRCAPARGAPVEDVAPFGLATFTALAEFAAVNHTCWFTDY